MDKHAAQPIVARLPDGDLMQLFGIGSGYPGRDGVDFTRCHHPAWSDSGETILCTRQEEPDELSVPGLEVRALYGYQFDSASSTWMSVGELVPSTDIRSDLAAFAGATTAVTLTYKFGHWCGSDQYIVATVFMEDAAKAGAQLASRVVLFDTNTGDAYDLVNAVEDLEGVTRGTYRAVFSACDGQ